MACSMYKITADDKTMVGCNEDAWRTTSRIWFVNAPGGSKHGAAFTGSRLVAPNRFTPQSGMNEAGLVFSRLSAYHPKQNSAKESIKNIVDEAEYLSSILHQCATVKDVAEFVSQYDRSFFIGDVFIYIDSTGNYLVVEPYELIHGNNLAYVLSNFCPSITEPLQAIRLERYRNGESFLEKYPMNTSLEYCRSLSDTMHVCRRNGDGTLLTSIWDAHDRAVNLYFYHQYDTTVQFVLEDELAKGDHMLAIPDLFPPSAEFQRLSSYITPFNTPALRMLLVVFGGVLTLFALVFVIAAFRKRQRSYSIRALVGLAGLNLLLTAHLAVLALDKSVYYFDAPYQHYSSVLVSATSYIPFLLLIAILPIATYTFRSFRSSERKPWLRILLVANNAIYAVLMLGFFYWGLFGVFS